MTDLIEIEPTQPLDTDNGYLSENSDDEKAHVNSEKKSKEEINKNTSNSCVVCGRGPKETSFSQKLMVNPDNKSRYENVFKKTLEIGKLCNGCYRNFQNEREKDMIFVCRVCEKDSTQTSFSNRNAVTKKNITKYKRFFKKDLKVGKVCNTCYQKWNTRGRKFAKSKGEENEDSLICVSCDNPFTNSTKCSYSVNENNLQRYEEFFQKKLEFGPLCKTCYNRFYYNGYRKKNAMRKRKIEQMEEKPSENSNLSKVPKKENNELFIQNGYKIIYVPIYINEKINSNEIQPIFLDHVDSSIIEKVIKDPLDIDLNVDYLSDDE